MTTDLLNPTQVLSMLGDMLQASESDTVRVNAAKVLLDRLAPKEDDEAKRHEAAERDAALATARGLLAEFAVVKLASLRLTRELAKAGEAGTNNASR